MYVLSFAISMYMGIYVKLSICAWMYKCERMSMNVCVSEPTRVDIYLYKYICVHVLIYIYMRCQHEQYRMD